jgi:hypothetical protein
MSAFFEIPHIFVVFLPGAGGNFISGILSKIFSESHNDLSFSNSGNAHLNSTSKLDFSDVMSCGLRYRTPDFTSFEEKLKFYKARIEETHKNDTDIKVSWSHDFSNIALYKKLFPNCKIVTVTQNSNNEKLAILIQQELKNRLDPAGFVFIKQEDSHLDIWKARIRLRLIELLGVENTGLAEQITNNYLDPKYRNIITLLAITLMIGFYDQWYLIDPSRTPEINYLNYCTVAKFILDRTYIPRPGDRILSVGPSIDECITEECFTIPYSVLMNNNLHSFTKIIGDIYGHELNSSQIEFIEKNFNSYYSLQSPGLFQDPSRYFRNLHSKANEEIRILKENTINNQ